MLISIWQMRKQAQEGKVNWLCSSAILMAELVFVPRQSHARILLPYLIFLFLKLWMFLEISL